MQPGKEPFRWLSIFDWSLRKGHDLLLEAFAKSFVHGEAELLIKTSPKPGQQVDLQTACERIVKAAADGSAPEVRVIGSILGQDEMCQLYAEADAFVLPSRGEGWGRPVQEAMLMELPVLVTAATALNTLVPDESLGFRLPAQRVPVSAEAAAETPCFADQSWFEVDATDLARRMREIFDDRKRAALRARRARSYALDLCDRNSIAAQLAAQLLMPT